MTEPIDWEKKWQDGNTQWDHGESSPALVTLIKEHSDLLPAKGRGLVPGCGSGKDIYFFDDGIFLILLTQLITRLRCATSGNS